MANNFLETHRGILGSIREPLLLLDSKLKIVTANAAFYRMFKVKPADTEGVMIYELGDGQWISPG